jgi:hypothetical protein
MALVNRQFTYKHSIKVSTDDLALAKSGSKTCTIRLGIAKVDKELMDLSDGRDVLKVRIVSVQTEPYRNLTHQHAQWEGFSTVEELRKDLEKYYRRIEQDQPVTIIRFERAFA